MKFGKSPPRNIPRPVAFIHDAVLIGLLTECTPWSWRKSCYSKRKKSAEEGEESSAKDRQPLPFGCFKKLLLDFQTICNFDCDHNQLFLEKHIVDQGLKAEIKTK